MKKGRYTRAARTMSRLPGSSGTAEAKVGKTLKVLGEILGVKIDHEVSRRAVQRFSLEIGVAADIQLVYEIINAGSKLAAHFKFTMS